MHDMDRTMFEAGEYENEQEDFLGILGSLLSGATGTGPETSAEGELEAAAELLEVRDEAELDRFFGDLFAGAAGAARDFAGSPTGQALTGIVKTAAKQALPVIGRGVGGWLSPDFAEPGARVASAAGDLLGLELEGLSAEDREFENARALVRWALAACRAAARAARADAGAPPATVARRAAAIAAQQHAPGLARLLVRSGNSSPSSRPGRAASGLWHRHGTTIVIDNP